MVCSTCRSDSPPRISHTFPHSHVAQLFLVIYSLLDDEDVVLTKIKISQGDYIYIRQLKIMFDDACALVRIVDLVNPFVEGAE